ncbi:MAG: aminotransferase class I/II-fold pyridoxal phosphate-dependent enzyme [Clostridiaceae bacterium]|nr:aminotransferase class I/II-fold pyridoxal phosphate-dependent enzyme [Clostridiaceae bacterium]
MEHYKDYDFSTKAVRAGWWKADPQTGSVAPPIYQTSTYAFNSVEDAEEALETHLQSGYIYTRGSSPTEILFEERMAALEGGEAALAFASGVSAVTSLVTFLVQKGDHIVASKTLYAATQFFFREILEKYGVETTFVDATEPANIADAIRKDTKVVFIETPANPTIGLTDIEAVGKITSGRELTTIVDTTFASPYLINPLDFEGIDVVLHSCTKYIGGHTDAMGGVIVGKQKLIDDVRMYSLINLGGVIDPFAAWLLLRGLKTIHLRVERHCFNAMETASFLEKHPKVERVFYPGLPSHPQHELAKRQMRGFGGMMAFELKGGVEAGKKLLNNLHLCRIAASLGDTDTLIEHPASMTHSELFVSREERLKQGITDGLVRLSVGIESVKDIISDLEQGLRFV